MQYGELYHRNFYREITEKNRVHYEYYNLGMTENVPEYYMEISFVCLREDGCLELPATDMLFRLWRKDDSVLDYAVPRAKKFVSGKRPQWDRILMLIRINYFLCRYMDDTSLPPVYGTKNCFNSYQCQIIKFFPKKTPFGEIRKRYSLSYLQNIRS